MKFPSTCNAMQPYQFGEFGGPGVGCDDFVFGHPVFVDSPEGLDGGLPLRSLISSDQHAVRVLQVRDGGSLSQELWVGQHLQKNHKLTRNSWYRHRQKWLMTWWTVEENTIQF